MSAYFILSTLTLIVSAGVVFFRSELNIYPAKTNSPRNSAFDIPSLFANNPNRDKAYSKLINSTEYDYKIIAANTTFVNSTGSKDKMMIDGTIDRNNFRYTHITKRMTLVNTH